VLRATAFLALASLAVAAGCTDQPALTAPPTHANAIVSIDPPPEPVTASVDGPVALEGFPGSTYNVAAAINDGGVVVGPSSLGGVEHAVRWPAGSTAPIDVGMGRPSDINNAGQIAGEFGIHAALWTPNGAGGYALTLLDAQLPSPNYSQAQAINANGQVVGSYQVQSNGEWVRKCFLWTPDKPNATTGTLTTLPDLGGTFCAAADINSRGYVVGASTTSKGDQHGFVWSPPSWGLPGRIRDLTPNGDPSYASSINDGGQIAGQHVTQTTASAAIWTPSGGQYVLTDIGTFTGLQTWATAINDAGFVVGWASGSNSAEFDAFFWQNGEFTLLPGTTSITNPTALTGLNGNSVQVVGLSQDAATGVATALRWNVTLTQGPPTR